MSVHDSAPEGRGRNFYRDDKALQAILDRLLDSRERGAAEPLLQRMGELAGGEIDRQAEYTDRQARPVLTTSGTEAAGVQTMARSGLAGVSAMLG